MFRIGATELGLVVSWSTTEEDLRFAAQLRDELLLRGLRRLRDSGTDLVVAKYRNLLETLGLVIEALNELGVAHTLEGEVHALWRARDVEREVLERARAAPGGPVDRHVSEFAGGRELLDYQAQAVGRHLRVHHGADFSVPGSGKTTVALAYWAHARREIPNLGLWVVGPTSCFRPWEDEFAACFGRDPAGVRLQGPPAVRERILREAHAKELLLSSYHTLWRDTGLVAAALQRRPWLLILDEAHYIKSMHGALSTAVRTVAGHAARRMVLTGTPMPRSPEDLWSQMTFLWPSEELLGTAVQHALRCKERAETATEELRVALAPFFHRTCKHQLGLRPIEAEYPVIAVEDIPQSQRLMMRLVERRTIEELKYLNLRDRAHLRRWRRARVVRLLQAASNPLLLANSLDWSQIALADEESAVPPADALEGLPLTQVDSALAAILGKYSRALERSAKLEFVSRRCRELVASGRKVVVWTVFLGNVELLAHELSAFDPITITGQVPLYEAEEDDNAEATREQRVELFKTDPRRRLLIANMAACSEAISLHKACQHAIYFERSFNAAQFVQSLDRIHRQGMPPGSVARVEIPNLPFAIERVLDRRLRDRQQRLYRLLDDPMSVVGFDDDIHRGVFDVADADDIDDLFVEVLEEVRRDLAGTPA